MSIWQNLPGATVYERGTFLVPGLYTLRVRNTLDKTTRKGRAFIVEFEVVESSNSTHYPGQRVTWFQKLLDLNIAMGAIKEFCGAVFEKDLAVEADRHAFDTQIAPSLAGIMEKATTENSLAGAVIRCEVTQVKTKAGTDFSRHTWMVAK